MIFLSTDVDKAVPPIRIDELNEDSSRRDHFVAAPPDEDLVNSWYAWAVIAFANGSFSFLVFLSIVTNRKVRRKPFNLYIIYLLIPDFTFSFLCTATCLLNAINGSYWSHWMCNFQQFYVVFGIGANAWLNFVIARQLHKILLFSNIRRRYKLPSRKQVTIHAIAAYSWCLFLGSWGTYESDHFPFQSGQASGLACLPMEGATKVSSLFFWLCFFPLFAGIPLAGVIWISLDIYFRKLMPPPGRRRVFMIYFGRLIVVFVVMWIPTLLIFFLLAPFLPQWIDFFTGVWSHMQGGLSAYIVLLKPDVWDAFKRLVTCHLKNDDIYDDSSNSAFSRIFGSAFRNSTNWFSRRSANITIDLGSLDGPIDSKADSLDGPADSKIDLEDDVDDSDEDGSSDKLGSEDVVSFGEQEGSEQNSNPLFELHDNEDYVETINDSRKEHWEIGEILERND